MSTAFKDPNLDHRIIESRCDQDAYKFSMAQGVFHNYTDVWVRYQFTCRSSDVWLQEYIPFIKAEIENLGNLRFQKNEIEGLRTGFPFLQEDFLQYLRNSMLNPEFVEVYDCDKNGGINIVIEGPWLDTIWFEVPILAIVSEIYMFDQFYRKGMTEEDALRISREILVNQMCEAMDKYDLNEYPKFADFGTRRRASVAVHRQTVRDMTTVVAEPCLGTSNVMLGLECRTKIVGTMAHEWIMAHAAFTRFDLSQRMALDVWQKEYRDQLGIALTDTYTTDFFLHDFDGLLARSFSGVRQDSGDPVEVGYKFIRHYESLGIDPMTKQIIFSDSLNFDKIAMLAKEFEGKIKASFGIGTNLTANIGPKIKPLSIVIKMTHVKYGNGVWYPMIKLSDVEGKTMCKDKEYAEFVRKIVRERVAD